MRHPSPDPIRPGDESVWDYPRPPRLEPVRDRLKVVLSGAVIAETGAGFRVLETSHPPTYYFPPGDVAAGILSAPQRGGICEWKGRAVLFDVLGSGGLLPGAAWSYPDPTPAFERIAGYVGFYAGPMDACFLGDARVVPQPGAFYGGWITPGIVGPFKGGPGSMGW